MLSFKVVEDQWLRLKATLDTSIQERQWLKGADQTPRSEKTAILRDPNHNHSDHIISQETMPSLGVENLRPKGILLPFSGNRILGKPRALKQSERRRESAVPARLTISTLHCTESGQ